MPQYATFYLGENLFGLDVMLVREINRNLEITPVNLAPPYVRGLLNLRGQIVTVLDLGIRLGLGNRDILSTSKIIILKTDDELAAKNADNTLIQDAPHDMAGLWVDDIGDMVLVDSHDVEPTPANIAGVDARFLRGIIKLEKQLLTIINTRAIVAMD